MAESDEEDLLRQAKDGDPSKVGRVLDAFRRQLRAEADARIGRRLQSKVSASDVVQETLLEAHRQFPRFQGTAPSQLAEWVHAIFAGTLANAIRRYLGTSARDLRRERALSDDAGLSSTVNGYCAVDSASSPSEQVQRREDAAIANELLNRLPPEYAEAIRLRHVEGLSFADVAARMGRTVDSVEKLWVRGLRQLRREYSREADK